MTNRTDAKQNAPLANSPRRRRISRGQSLVEFALIATLALAVILVGVQFAIIGQAALAVSQGSSVLARYAAVNPGSFGTYNSGSNSPIAASSLPSAASSLLSPTINDSNLTVSINSYTGTTTTTTSTPQATIDRVVVTLNYNATSKIVLPSSTLLGISFPTALSASDSRLYE
jgi:Flp pilus assembly protein TadG